MALRHNGPAFLVVGSDAANGYHEEVSEGVPDRRSARVKATRMEL